MTINDNIRHYIGSLEATEDIDVMFKHIYDLMLANGGENSALNADMVDGYHASDFAPASIKTEIDDCVRSIELNGEKHIAKDIVMQLIADQIPYGQDNDTVESFLDALDGRVTTSENTISTMSGTLNNISSFLGDATTQEGLRELITNKLYIETNNNVVESYLNADSINGLSFEILTQEQYDALPVNKKEDPRNIYIINDNIGEYYENGTYQPPSILRASMSLQFRINIATKNLEFSIDGQTWNVLMPLVGSGVTDDDKGLLYPAWFEFIKDAMDDENLYDQTKYPFLLNSNTNKNALATDLANRANNRIGTIQIGSNVITPASNSNIANISASLDAYISSWISNNNTSLKNNLGISSLETNINTKESLSNKVSSTITGNGSTTEYPSTKAVINYVNSQINGVQTSLGNQIEEGLAESDWVTVPAFTNFFRGNVYFKKIGRWVYVTCSVNTKTSIVYNKYDDYWNICDIPSGYAPDLMHRVIAQCSANDRCYIGFYPEGYAKIGRFNYNNARTGSYTIPKDYWITFSTTYPAKI